MVESIGQRREEGWHCRGSYRLQPGANVNVAGRLRLSHALEPNQRDPSSALRSSAYLGQCFFDCKRHPQPCKQVSYICYNSGTLGSALSSQGSMYNFSYAWISRDSGATTQAHACSRAVTLQRRRMDPFPIRRVCDRVAMLAVISPVSIQSTLMDCTDGISNGS